MRLSAWLTTMVRVMVPDTEMFRGKMRIRVRVRGREMRVRVRVTATRAVNVNKSG